ncbi:MAG: heat-inducible transcriptional repressor HrcA [Rhodospirillaceae bacterium]|nr:heat-inducible transcriptional repressor HrcA [Rhodospirillaceae bacterium]
MNDVISELSSRSREIFRGVVEAFFETGEPVGSRTLSRTLRLDLSPATIRNVMADLEEAGLLYAPHKSAGRLPTDRGVRLFVDGLLQVGELTNDERENIESRCAGNGRSLSAVLNETTEFLSGLTKTAGIVIAPKSDAAINHVDFVLLSSGNALAIMVTKTGLVENRLIELPMGSTPSSLVQAANYLNAQLAGRTLLEAHKVISQDLDTHSTQLDVLAERVVEAGLATWSTDGEKQTLILRGKANLFDEVDAVVDLERLRQLLDTLEQKKGFLKVIEQTEAGEGVHVFIGSENRLFNLAGCSMIVAPLAGGANSEVGAGRPLGAIGVIGPTRLNYARIIPMVDFTARAVSRLMG